MTTNEAREKILEFMCKLGQRYLKDGDTDEAIRWLKAAADLGSDDMHKKISCEMYMIGKRYFGESFLDDSNLDKAFRWFKAAADLGDDCANCELGFMYYFGRGVEKNIAKAVEYCKVAADLGDYEACFLLFKMYREGETKIKPDIEKAVDYLAYIALEDEEGHNYITTAEYLYEEGYIYPLLDGRSVLDYYGDDNARFELGCMYLYGDYVERDVFKAACWFANMNDYSAGWLTDTNSYVDDTEKFYDALFDLAECYRTGDGIKKNMDRAVAWYEQILNYCYWHDKALFTLAEIYFNGDGVEQDVDRAIELYKQAADNDNLKAAYKLAKIYRDGIGVDKDTDAAQEFLDKTINGLLENFGA